MSCFKPLNGYKRLDNGGITFDVRQSAGQKMKVACGSCLGCRLDHSRTWAMRIVHESTLWEDKGGNSFITLTYNDEHVPKDGSLRKPDFQKFMKRLRKKLGDRKVRYYMCGEYGDQNQRPHFHAILFNFDFSEDKELFQERDGNLLFTSKLLEQLWPFGFSTIGDVTFESAAYVARYALKKVTGERAHDHYLRCDEDGVAYWLEPEYTTMSRGRPCKEHAKLNPDCDKCHGGIGAKWYARFKTDVFPSDEVPVPGRGVFKKVPRYYEKLLERSDPDLFKAIKDKRKAFVKKNVDEYSPERLEQKFRVKRAQTNQLVRTL